MSATTTLNRPLHQTGFIFTTARVRSTAFLPRILKERKGLSVRLPSDNDLVPSKQDREGVCTPSISRQLETGGWRVPSRRLPGSGFQDNRTQVKVQNWSPSACGLLLWELDEGRWALCVVPHLWPAVAKPPPWTEALLQVDPLARPQEPAPLESEMLWVHRESSDITGQLKTAQERPRDASKERKRTPVSGKAPRHSVSKG